MNIIAVVLFLNIKCSFFPRKHKIDEQLLTPRRDHIVFPKTVAAQEKGKVRLSEIPSHKQKLPLAKRHELPITTSRDTSPADRRPLKRQAMLSEEVASSKGRDVRHPNQLGKGKAVSLRKVKKLRDNDLSREEVSGTASLKKVKKLQENDLSREEASGTASLKKVKNLWDNDLSREGVSGTVATCSRSPSPREVAIGDLPNCSGNIPHSSFPVIDAPMENK